MIMVGLILDRFFIVILSGASVRFKYHEHAVNTRATIRFCLSGCRSALQFDNTTHEYPLALPLLM